MPQESYRYFIQLQNLLDGTLPRYRAQQLHRQQAEDFIAALREWLEDQGLQAEVKAISATLFGQIQITCTAQVIQQLRNHDLQDIAAIRQGSMSQNFARLSETHGF